MSDIFAGIFLYTGAQVLLSVYSEALLCLHLRDCAGALYILLSSELEKDTITSI